MSVRELKGSWKLVRNSAQTGEIKSFSLGDKSFILPDMDEDAVILDEKGEGEIIGILGGELLVDFHITCNDTQFDIDTFKGKWKILSDGKLKVEYDDPYELNIYEKVADGTYNQYFESLESKDERY